MISYLEKFNSLPKDIKSKVSSPEVMNKISALEKKYGISLASVLMRLMVKELKLSSLVDFLVEEDGLHRKRAEEVVENLKADVLKPFWGHLGLEEKKSASAGIKVKDNHPVPMDEVPHYFNEGKRSSKSSQSDDTKLDNWMKDRKSDMSSRSSGFFFSSEDEEEVRKLAKKVANFSRGAKPKFDSQEALDKIIQDTNLNFSSEDMKTRFKNIIKTYLHGVRNWVDTKQTLIKSVEVGGLGIDDKQADDILKQASNFRREPDKPTLQSEKKKDKTEEEVDQEEILDQEEKKNYTMGNGGDVDYDFESLLKGKSKEGVEEKAKQKQLEEKQKAAITKEEKTEEKPLKREKSTYVEKEKKEEEEEEKEEFIDLTKLENLKDNQSVDIGKKMRSASMTQREQESDINIIQARAAAKKDGKVKMEDVKHVPKLTGPIDELREMSLLNFRRLSRNPRDAVLKIKKKISFLEEESYTKRFEGIKAWRQSPVNKLYLEIGQESIINKKPINVIIQNRKQARKPYLSELEFKAVMDLNKDLRF